VSNKHYNIITMHGPIYDANYCDPHNSDTGKLMYTVSALSLKSIHLCKLRSQS